jgi:hypothetical protein
MVAASQRQATRWHHSISLSSSRHQRGEGVLSPQGKIAVGFNSPRFLLRILGMPRCSMDIDQEKLEQTVLALLYLTSFKDRLGLRAWKGHDWKVMNFLHEKGYISNPASKAKSVAFTEEGARFSKELFEKLFAIK